MTDLLATYLLHSTVILGTTLLMIQLPGLRRATARDTLLRTAFVVSLLTPWGTHSPTHMRIPVSQPATVLAPLPASRDSGIDLDSNIASRSTTELDTLERQARPPDSPVSVHHLMALLPWALLLLTVVAVGRFARAATHARRLIRQARPVDLEAAETHHDPHVQILCTEELDVPVAIGLRTILLPANVIRSLDSDELRAVLAHELAHIQRRDPIWNTCLSFASHALAFQPLNLLALRAWRRASEEVCDGAAQERLDQPLALPRALVKLAHRRTTLPTIAVGVLTDTHLTHRVEALLNKRETRMKPSRLITLALIPLAVGLLLPIVSSAQPTTPPAGMKVVIDPGHGGSEPGALGFAREADVVLAIALHARRILSEHGIDVALTRETSDGPALTQRRALVDEEADAFISIHASASTQNTAHGVQTWVAPPSQDNDATHSLDLELARALQAELIQSTNARDRGVHEQEWYVLQELQIPAALIEVGFLTHPDEGARLATSAYQEKLARAIADAILRFLQTREAENAAFSNPAAAPRIPADADASGDRAQLTELLGQLADTNRRFQEVQATARDLGEMLNDPEVDLATKATIRREFEASMRERMELLESFTSLRSELDALNNAPLLPASDDRLNSRIQLEELETQQQEISREVWRLQNAQDNLLHALRDSDLDPTTRENTERVLAEITQDRDRALEVLDALRQQIDALRADQ